MAQSQFDVAVVGFGPVGAVLAGLLGKRGLSVVVFDREAGIYPLPRAAHIDHTGLRTLQELGCLAELLPTMLINPGTDCVTADRRVLFEIPGNLPTVSNLPASAYFYQPTFDTTLRRTVTAMSTVEVRLRTEVIDLVQEREGVWITTRGDDGAESIVQASWVVGCDGAGSRVRQVAAIDQTDFGFDEKWLIFDLRLSDPRPPMPRCAVQVCDPARPHTELPMPSGRYRFEFMLMPGEDAVELLRPEAAFDRLLAGLVPRESAEIERTTSYTFRGLTANRWRVGRIFVAGDAAHLMPPFLGQGMCSGIRDAANLAWKLSFVLRNDAPARLLDTYQTERRPHVSQVIKAAIELGRIICTTDRAAAENRDVEMLANDERTPPYGFTLPRLTPGPLVLEGGGELCMQSGPDTAGRRLDDILGQRFLVITPEGANRTNTARWWTSTLGAFVTPVSGLPDPDGRFLRWVSRRLGRYTVIRPDRYVLWSGDDLESATEAVRPWLSDVDTLPSVTAMSQAR